MQRDFRPLVLVVLLVLVTLRSGGGGIISPHSGKVTQATYIYEKDESVPPRDVQAALRDLNANGILAAAIDDDVVNGDGDVPEQYKIALAAAAGKIPCLVVQAGDKVLKVIEDPTAADVTGVAG